MKLELKDIPYRVWDGEGSGGKRTVHINNRYDKIMNMVEECRKQGATITMTNRVSTAKPRCGEPYDVLDILIIK